MYMKKD